MPLTNCIDAGCQLSTSHIHLLLYQEIYREARGQLRRSEWISLAWRDLFGASIERMAGKQIREVSSHEALIPAAPGLAVQWRTHQSAREVCVWFLREPLAREKT